MLKIYNSLTGKHENLTPIREKKISMYVCGNTMYDYCHLGHARAMIMFDVVNRYLRYRYPDYVITYVRNFTDIDDKIIKRAQENNETIDSLTNRFINAQYEDEKALGLLPPDYEPRATAYIPQMIELIQQLITQGYAYVAEEGTEKGDVLFNVKKFKNYGKLSGNTVEKLLSDNKTGGELAEKAGIFSNKASPLDFALWKISKPGEPHWPSPWGEGRPGWHIECSAMSTGLLGQPFDIHGGGMDLKFPHHENEIAQSEAACGKQFARLWMHIGLLQVDGEKMSKSLGNFLTIRDALAQCHPEELRFFMMNSLYRKPADYAEKNMHEVERRLFRLYQTLDQLPEPPAGAIDDSNYREKFHNAMDDDFNTSVALAVLGDLGARINVLIGEGDLTQAAILGKTLRELANILGILKDNNYLKGDLSEEKKIESLIDARNISRTRKNWQEADNIRRQLLDMGIVIEDSATGTRWRRERS